MFLALVIAAPLVIHHLPHNPDHYHPDEGGWTAAEKDEFRLFFVERDWSYRTWNQARSATFGAHSPVVGKYIIGGALFLSGDPYRQTVFPDFEHVLQCKHL